MIPHVTDVIQSWLENVAKIPVDGSLLEPEVCLIEVCLLRLSILLSNIIVQVGGTVGDIESMVFLEALRQFQFKVGRENIVFILVSLVPTVGSDVEHKTKPTQHSVKELRGLGLYPGKFRYYSHTTLYIQPIYN
jgi:CTP synthase